MVQYIISTKKYPQTILKSLHEDKSYIKQMKKRWKHKEQDGTHYFEINILNDKEDDIVNSIVKMLTDIIQTEVLIDFTRSYVKKIECLEEVEKKEIGDMFILNNYVDGEEGVSYISYYLLYTPILKFLKDSKYIHLDGWIMFRTWSYKVILSDMIEQAIYDYETQKDYLRFIYLLRENRKLQQSIESEIHIVPFEDSIDLYNKKGKRITDQYIKLYSAELIGEEGVTTDDLIMNTLITISPEKICIHRKKACTNQALIETIEKIFEEYVTHCNGCSLCKNRENMLT